MDKEEKKRLANEKRLKAVQEWQRNRNQNIIKISKAQSDTTKFSPPNKRQKFFDNDNFQNTKTNKLKLFDSDDEKEDLSACFKIRPQFEGKNGLRMLEMSSELNDRFKLDERFREEDNNAEEDPEDSEKLKNIRILENILGHEISKKHPNDVIAKKKKEIERFDPEAESSNNCVKTVENVQRKVQKKNKKINHSETNEEIPHSSERYIEVASNLKEIMNTSSTFSFSEKFKRNKDYDEIKEETISNQADSMVENSPYKKSQSLDLKESNQTYDSSYNSNFKDPFFISETDERLKEGVEFFVRPKSLDDIRDEWLKKKSFVLEIFKRRKRSAKRNTAKRPKVSQTQHKKFLRKK